MSEIKHFMQPGAILSQMQELLDKIGSASPAAQSVEMATLLTPWVDRVRLFETKDRIRSIVKEVSVAHHELKGSITSFQAYLTARGEMDKLRAATDPGISIDFTIDSDTGSLTLDLDTGPALEGQDLSRLATAEIPPAEAPETHAPLEDEFMSVEQAAEALGVAPTTVTRRINANEMLGFKLFKKTLRIPKDQIVHGDVAAGIKETIAMFDGNHKETWFFLSSPIFYGDSAPRPIDRLRAVRSERELKECLDLLKTAKVSHDYGDHF